jgi:hypothetical protein
MMTHQHYGWNPGLPVVPSSLVPLPTFSGHFDKTSPTEFIGQFERYAAALGRQPQDLFAQLMPCALEGDANSWWKFYGEFTHYDTFTAAIKREYGATNYRVRLQRELEERTQHWNEPLASFVRVIHEYYERLGSAASDQEKVRRVLSQMHPEYRRYTYGRYFVNLKDLATKAIDIQAEVLAERNYRSPPPDQCVEPSLAFQDFSRGLTPLNARTVSLEALELARIRRQRGSLPRLDRSPPPRQPSVANVESPRSLPTLTKRVQFEKSPPRATREQQEILLSMPKTGACEVSVPGATD